MMISFFLRTPSVRNRKNRAAVIERRDDFLYVGERARITVLFEEILFVWSRFDYLFKEKIISQFWKFH